MKKLIQAQIDKGETITCVSAQVFKEFQTIFLHLKRKEIPCDKCGLAKENPVYVENFAYKNLADFLNDREILEGMIE
jgi:hypothetical protein